MDLMSRKELQSRQSVKNVEGQVQRDRPISDSFLPRPTAGGPPEIPAPNSLLRFGGRLRNMLCFRTLQIVSDSYEDSDHVETLSD